MKNNKWFTIIEVVTAIVILWIISISIMNLVQATLSSQRISSITRDEWIINDFIQDIKPIDLRVINDIENNEPQYLWQVFQEKIWIEYWIPFITIVKEWDWEMNLTRWVKGFSIISNEWEDIWDYIFEDKDIEQIEGMSNTIHGFLFLNSIRWVNYEDLIIERESNQWLGYNIKFQYDNQNNIEEILSLEYDEWWNEYNINLNNSYFNDWRYIDRLVSTTDEDLWLFSYIKELWWIKTFCANNYTIWDDTIQNILSSVIHNNLKRKSINIDTLPNILPCDYNLIIPIVSL